MQIKNKTNLSTLKKKDLRLDKFIECALYLKDNYYSNKQPIGSKKDFITSPEISQMFGEIVGLFILEKWNRNFNSSFNLIELGPGKGTLFSDIYRTCKINEKFINNSNIIFVEKNRILKKIQKKIINNLRLKNVKWRENISIKSKLPVIFYSNEFFDCFPIRHFIYKNFWKETFVSFDKLEKRFFFKQKKVFSKSLLNKLIKYKKDQIFEFSMQRNVYFSRICKLISKNKGFCFLTDYGYTGKIKNFTLQTIKNHNYTNIFDNIGKQDISSHVNFDELIKIAKENNLKVDEFSSQKEFLIKYGILDRMEHLINNNPGMKKDLNIETQRLIANNQMGKLFKCLVVSNK